MHGRPHVLEPMGKYRRIYFRRTIEFIFAHADAAIRLRIYAPSGLLKDDPSIGMGSRIVRLVLLLWLVGAQAQTWTPDNGNGTYTNLLCYDEFSDPAVVSEGAVARQCHRPRRVDRQAT